MSITVSRSTPKKTEVSPILDRIQRKNRGPVSNLYTKNVRGVFILDMAKFLAYILAMKTANIGDLKDNLSKFINFVEQGEVIEICKRNIPIALLVPHGSRKTPNRTQLGCGEGTVQVKGDLTEPLIPEDSWDMLK